MIAICMRDKKKSNVHIASFKHQMKYGAEYEEEIVPGTMMLLIPVKEKEIPDHQKYRHFIVNNKVYESLFVR
ncbi:hypothetical protein [Faecalitalea cylindroides]|uniref:hypothetical protein n=1 Tax=Faecalitalea cylindroides TaxID=39483 RepID=UPI002E7A17CE|nr:hypothetical protein [Faecalitalea cylindroides]MEE1449673.1 hypothetical protein [Faecalitalea cylindroides]